MKAATFCHRRKVENRASASAALIINVFFSEKCCDFSRKLADREVTFDHCSPWVALGKSFHLCRLKKPTKIRNRNRKRTFSPTEEGRISGSNCCCFDTERQIPENIFLFFVRTFVEGSFSSIPSVRRMGQIKKTKCLDGNSAFGLKNNKPVKCLHV